MSDTTTAQAREPVTVDKPPQAFEAWYWSQYYRLNLEGWDRHGVAQLAWEKQAARITELEAQVAQYKQDAERYRWLRDHGPQEQAMNDPKMPELPQGRPDPDSDGGPFDASRIFSEHEVQALHKSWRQYAAHLEARVATQHAALEAAYEVLRWVEDAPGAVLAQVRTEIGKGEK